MEDVLVAKLRHSIVQRRVHKAQAMITGRLRVIDGKLANDLATDSVGRVESKTLIGSQLPKSNRTFPPIRPRKVPKPPFLRRQRKQVEKTKNRARTIP